MGFFKQFKSKDKPKEPIIIKPIKTKPKKYWGYCYNEKFNVYCNGATVYVYDKVGNELSKFKDVPYAYRAKFMPHTNILVVKSTSGYLAIYDLNTLTLLKKMTVSRVGAQDEGFAFSFDGQYFCNIEKPVSSLHTQLAVYRTSDFKQVSTLFLNNKIVNLKHIEFDTNNKCYVLGFVRNDEGVYDYGFIGELVEKGIKNIKKLNKDDFEYIRAFKNWEDFGFTEKEYENTILLKDKENIEYVSLKDLYNKSMGI